MFIQTEATPNPNTMMFFPNIDLIAEEPITYANKEACGNSPLAQALFKLEAVTSVFFGRDFITVTKAEEIDWETAKFEILTAIADHFAAGGKVFSEAPSSLAKEATGEEDHTIRAIQEIIEHRVRPAVAADGGDISFESFDREEGIVWLRLSGSCSGCPSSTITLKNGIESMLKHYVPEVKSVEAID